MLCASRQRWRAALHFCGDSDGACAVLADASDGEEMGVGSVAVQRCFARGYPEIIDLPARLRGFTPQDFEAGAIGILFGGPGDFGVRGDGAGEPCVCWRCGSHCQLAQSLGIVACDVAEQARIQVFCEVAILNAILCARRLMLVSVVLERFRKAHGGKSGFVEGVVVAAPAVTIDTKNHADVFAAVDFLDGAGQFAAGRIAIVDFAVAGEETHTMRGSRRRLVAYDVVSEHAADGVALLLGPVEQMIATEQTLFFAGNGGEQDRGAVSALAVCGGYAEEAGGFHADGNT